MEARELVRVRQPARLGEEPRVFEGRPEDPRELLELLQLRVRQCLLDPAPEDGQRPDPLGTFAEERDGETTAQPELVVRCLFGRVEVAEAHRAGAACVRRKSEELA